MLRSPDGGSRFGAHLPGDKSGIPETRYSYIDAKCGRKSAYEPGSRLGNCLTGLLSAGGPALQSLPLQLAGRQPAKTATMETITGSNSQSRRNEFHGLPLVFDEALQLIFVFFVYLRIGLRLGSQRVHHDRGKIHTYSSANEALFRQFFQIFREGAGCNWSQPGS